MHGRMHVGPGNAMGTLVGISVGSGEGIDKGNTLDGGAVGVAVGARDVLGAAVLHPQTAHSTVRCVPSLVPRSTASRGVVFRPSFHGAPRRVELHKHHDSPVKGTTLV